MLLDAKRVLFLGDSITYSGQYVETVAAYFATRFPGRPIEFLNLGLPSETVSGLSEDGHAGGQFPRPELHERLARVLAKTKPDTVIACYGMNDGIYLPFTQERFAAFSNGLVRLRERVAAAGARVIHVTPPVFDETKGNGPGYANTLDRYSDWMLGQHAAGWDVVDLHGPMNRVLIERRKADPKFFLAGDGVHAGELGHWIIAQQILLHLGANDLAKVESAADMMLGHPSGAALMKLVQQQQRLLKDAWLTDTGHKRPGMNKGLPLAEAQTRAAALDAQIRALAKPQATTAFPASDWPQWRGPDRNGVSAESGWLDQWPANGPTTAWKAHVGLGYSSFVVAEGRAFTAGHADEKDTVFCFDANSGKVLWKHSYPSDLGDKYFDGGTTGTPAVESGRVFWLSRWGDTFCFNTDDGKIIWSKNVQKETRARLPDWGFAGAPLVLGDQLILNVGDAGLALDKKTGAVLWQSAAKSAGYSTPLPMKQGNDTLAVIGSAQSYVAVNLKDGKEVWRIRWLTQYGLNAADPVLDGDRVFLSTGYGKGAGLFKLGGGTPEEVWKSKALRTQLNGAVLFQGHLYGVDGDTTEKGSLQCLDIATGAEKWKHSNFGSGGLVIAGGRILALSGAGELMVAPASPGGFKPAARAQVLGGQCWTAPVLAEGRIYCRNSRGEIAVVDVRQR